MESVTLHNKGSAAVDMIGWTLEDDSDKVWALASLGTINSGQSATIQRDGIPMTLNNGGDDIKLINSSGQQVDHFPYTGSQEGVSIPTNH